jgi:hypothetical protein
MTFQPMKSFGSWRMSSGGRSDATLEEPAAKLPDEPIVFENMSFHHAQTGDGLTDSSDEHGVL